MAALGVLVLCAVLWFVLRKPAPSPRERTAQPRFEVTIFVDGVEQPRDIGAVAAGPNLRDLPNGAFVLEQAVSRSGRFVFGVRPQHSERMNGRTKTISGGIALFEGTRCRWEQTLPAPSCCAVADDGTSIVADVQAAKLQTRIRVFSPDGQQIFDGRRTALAYNCGISPDGTIAVCQMCNSRTDTGGRLIVINTRTGKEIGRPYPPRGWADGYAFDTERHVIALSYQDGQTAEVAYALRPVAPDGEAPGEV